MDNMLLLDTPVTKSPWLASLPMPGFGASEESIVELLHSELELLPLLEKYLTIISQRLNICGITFAWKDETYQLGETAAVNNHSFLLRLDAQYMVKITYYSRSGIGELKQRKLKWVQQQAFYPIRNAMKYAEALQASRQDHLTGLGNRGYFNDVIGYHLQQAQRFRQQLAVMMIDMDFFKQVNDTHGHAEGDRVLVEFGTILNSVIRGSDLAFRLGGDEFILLLVNSNEHACQTLASRLQTAVRDNPLLLARGVTCSIGFAQWNEPESLDSWMARADKALYQAKDAGRNCAISA